MLLLNFPESLNIITDSQYAERVGLHIETTEFIPDNSELTILFMQLQQAIRNKNYLLQVTHIQSHIGFTGPFVKGNEEIDQLIVNILEASKFCENSMLRVKV